MSPVSFYKGRVAHQRFSGPGHRLDYRIAYVLVDLDRMDEANAASRFLGVGKGGLMSVRAEDHGEGRPADLAAWVREKVRAEGVEDACARIELLTLPRMFGYVFNPISVYFLYATDGALHHILYEVNNTFGGRHFYLARPDADDRRLRHGAEKALYVSPFFDVEGGYEFSVSPPDARILLNIDYRHADGARALNASLSGTRTPVNDRTALGLLPAFPFMTLGVIAAIHWEALKLFVKGARYRSEDDAGAPRSAKRAAQQKGFITEERKAA